MACFLAPVGEAIVVTTVKKIVEKVEKSKGNDVEQTPENNKTLAFCKKVGRLTNLLWGGSFLLAIEHMWHGEVVPFPPFLTAMESPLETSQMLHEIATVGTSMALLVTAVWAGSLAVEHVLSKKSNKILAKKKVRS